MIGEFAGSTADNYASHIATVQVALQIAGWAAFRMMVDLAFRMIQEVASQRSHNVEEEL